MTKVPQAEVKRTRTTPQATHAGPTTANAKRTRATTHATHADATQPNAKRTRVTTHVTHADATQSNAKRTRVTTTAKLRQAAKSAPRAETHSTATRGEATQQRLLDAALAVYHAHGHEGFNVHAIVAASGASLGSLYHHFGSMDGLAAALYARSMRALLAQVVAGLSGARSLREGVTRTVRAYLGFARQQRTAMLFIHASSYASFLPAHAAQIADSKARMPEIRAFFFEHVAVGHVVPVPEALLEVLVIGPVAELTRRWLAAPELIDLQVAERELPERIIAAIQTQPPARRRARPRR